VGTEPEKLRIAFTSQPFLSGQVHEDCVRGLEKTAELCRDLDHEVVEAAPQIDGKAFAEAFLTVVCAETRADLKEAEVWLARKATSRDFEPATWAIGLLGRHISALELSRAVRRLQKVSRQVGCFFQEYDILLTPTLAKPPAVTGEHQPPKAHDLMMKLLGRVNAGGLLKVFMGIEALAVQAFERMPYTPLFNATGQPAMSVPLYWNDEGLPIGMHFIARYGDEATLFRLAGQLEKAAPWFDRIPHL